MPDEVRSYFEPRFGRDFSQVRVHTDDRAIEGARAVQARAYTLGRDIAFAAEEFSPATTNGQRLIAHELAHVVQPGRASTLSATTSPSVARYDPLIQRDTTPTDTQMTRSDPAVQNVFQQRRNLAQGALNAYRAVHPE